AAGYRQVKVLEFFDCPRQGVEDLRELLHKQRVKRMASMNTRLNIEKLDGNIVHKQPEKKTNTDCLVKELEKEYQTGWKIKTEDTTMSTYLVNRSSLSAIEFIKPIDMLGIFGWLASIKKGILEPVKVKCIFLVYHKNIMGNKLWRLDDVTSKVVLYRNMGFNESEEYKKTFIGSGVGTGSMQVLHGFEFEVELLGDHTFEVEPQENVDQRAGLQEAKIWATEGLLDKAKGNVLESRYELRLVAGIATGALVKGGSRSKVSAQVEVVAYRFYNGKLVQTLLEGHSILLLDDSLAGDCDVEKNGRQESEWLYSEGVTVQVLQQKLVQTLLEGHSILSLKGSLSSDCDVEKNDVGMLDGFDRGLQTYVQVFVDFDYAMGRSITVMGRSITRYGFMILGCAGSLKVNLQDMKALSTTEARYMTFTEAWKRKMWLKGLLTESRYELRLVAGIATGALVKGGSRSEVPAQVEVRQPTLSRSSAEAEYRGVANVVAETCWLRNLLRELYTPLSSATLVYCNNVSAIFLSANPAQHQRTKHIEIYIHFIRDLIAAHQVRVLHVSSRYQYANIFTKGLPSTLFEEFRTSLSFRYPPAQTADVSRYFLLSSSERN
nr:NBS-containing resistance-like protein [Tanacetum cinerariifolium]